MFWTGFATGFAATVLFEAMFIIAVFNGSLKK